MQSARRMAHSTDLLAPSAAETESKDFLVSLDTRTYIIQNTDKRLDTLSGSLIIGSLSQPYAVSPDWNVAAVNCPLMIRTPNE